MILIIVLYKKFGGNVKVVGINQNSGSRNLSFKRVWVDLHSFKDPKFADAKKVLDNQLSVLDFTSFSSGVDFFVAALNSSELSSSNPVDSIGISGHKGKGSKLIPLDKFNEDSLSDGAYDVIDESYNQH